MNAADLLALLTQSANTALVIGEILTRMNSEGRDKATPEETARARALAVDSDARLSQAIARG